MTDERRTTGNMRLAQWGLTCKIESSCFYLALVHIDSVVLLSPPLRQAQKRYRQVLTTVTTQTGLLKTDQSKRQLKH